MRIVKGIRVLGYYKNFRGLLFLLCYRVGIIESLRIVVSDLEVVREEREWNYKLGDM